MFIRIRFLVSFLLICIGCCAVKAQQPDSGVLVLPDSAGLTSTDTLPTKKQFFVKRFFSSGYPNPRRAALLSAILPGAGQVYNKRWWKLPLVYGALGTALYFEVDNINQYHKLRDNYKWLVDGNPDTNPTEPPYNQIDATAMKAYRDQWRRYVEFSSIVLGLAYLLQVTDAFVDAHLQSFDVSDDLSLRFQPKLESAPGFGVTFGAGISLQFKSPTSVNPKSIVHLK